MHKGATDEVGEGEGMIPGKVDSPEGGEGRGSNVEWIAELLLDVVLNALELVLEW